MYVNLNTNQILYIYTCYSEESSKIPGVGIDMLLKNGKLDHLKDADSHPCMGTGSAAMWTLKCTGKLFHSGLPHKVQCIVIVIGTFIFVIATKNLL